MSILLSSKRKFFFLLRQACVENNFIQNVTFKYKMSDTVVWIWIPWAPVRLASSLQPGARLIIWCLLSPFTLALAWEAQRQRGWETYNKLVLASLEPPLCSRCGAPRSPGSQGVLPQDPCAGLPRLHPPAPAVSWGARTFLLSCSDVLSGCPL